VATKDEIKESKVRMSEVESRKETRNKWFVNLGKESILEGRKPARKEARSRKMKKYVMMREKKMIGEVRKQQPLYFVDKKSEIKSINEVVKVKNKSHFEGEEEAWLRQ
jgi:hypothetical protein